MEKKIYVIFLAFFVFLLCIKGMLYLDATILPPVSIENASITICNIKKDCDYLNQDAVAFAKQYRITHDDKDGKFIDTNIIRHIFDDCRFNLKTGDECINKGIEYYALNENIINSLVFFDFQPLISELDNVKKASLNKEIYYILYQKNNETYLLEAHIPFKKGVRKFNQERKSAIYSFIQLIEKELK